MNTLGLGRKTPLNTYGLGKIQQIILDGWKDAIRFSAFIKRKLLNKVEF